MAKVVAPEGFSLELDSERMTFGYSTEVEVPLLPELGVGERQFTIVRFGQKHFIEHAGDRKAPTLVNGDPITKHRLEDGDEISAGDLILIFRVEDGAGVVDEVVNRLPQAELPADFQGLQGNPPQRQSMDAKVKLAEKPRLFGLAEESVAASLGQAAQAAEQAWLAAEAKTAEEARRVAEAQAAEETRRAAEAKALEEARRAAEARALEEARWAAEAKAVEEARRAAEREAMEAAQRAAEAKAVEEARRAAEREAMEAAQRAAEAKAVEEARRAAEREAMEAAQRAAEAKAVEEAQRAAEAKAVEEARRAAEEREAMEASQRAAEAKAMEARRAAEARAAEEARLAVEARAVEEARRAAEARSLEAARRAAEEQALEEARRAAEASALEEARWAAEAKAVEEARWAAEAKAVEEARLAAEAKAAEEAWRAVETRALEAARVVEHPDLARVGAQVEIATPVEIEKDKETKKPGVETQRINLASAISSALTPRSSLIDTEPKPNVISGVEQLDLRANAVAQAGQALPPRSTDIAGPPAGTSWPGSPVANPTLPSTPTLEVMPAGGAVASPTAEIAPPPASGNALVVPTLPTTPAEASPAEEPADKPALKQKSPKSARTIKPRKQKGVRRPLFPLLRVAIPGIFTLAALLAAGYYAWENYLKPEEKPREFVFASPQPAGFPSAEFSAQDVLRFLPAEAEKAAYLDVRAAFAIWSTSMNPKGEPVYNPIDDFIYESTGLGLADLDYICIGGDEKFESFVALASFAKPLNPAELYSGIEQTGSRVIRVETIDGAPLRVLEREGRVLEFVLVDQHTVLISSSGRMRPAIKASLKTDLKHGPVTTALGRAISGGVACAVTGTPRAMGLGPIFESLGCPLSGELLAQSDSMESITVSCQAASDIEATLEFNASDPEQAARMTPVGSGWLASAPSAVRDAFQVEVPDTPFPPAFDRLLGSAEWATSRTANRLRLRLQRRDIATFIRAFQASGDPSVTASARPLQNAKKFASVFAAAVAAGNADLADAGSVERAIEMISAGVMGAGASSGSEFRVEVRLSPAEIREVSRYLVWRGNALVFREPEARPVSRKRL